jgi:bifunctional ADP-heptose synthase (sugar kinase/adenylyltransferase)
VLLLETPLAPLTPRARAEMAAALGVVDYVVIAGSGMPAGRLLAALEPHAVVRCEAAHEEHMRQFIHHVHRRQRNGSQ